jgi:hypothetical protein
MRQIGRRILVTSFGTLIGSVVRHVFVPDAFFRPMIEHR